MNTNIHYYAQHILNKPGYRHMPLRSVVRKSCRIVLFCATSKTKFSEERLKRAHFEMILFQQLTYTTTTTSRPKISSLASRTRGKPLGKDSARGTRCKHHSSLSGRKRGRRKIRTGLGSILKRKTDQT